MKRYHDNFISAEETFQKNEAKKEDSLGFYTRWLNYYKALIRRFDLPFRRIVSLARIQWAVEDALLLGRDSADKADIDAKLIAAVDKLIRELEENPTPFSVNSKESEELLLKVLKTFEEMHTELEKIINNYIPIEKVEELVTGKIEELIEEYIKVLNDYSYFS